MPFGPGSYFRRSSSADWSLQDGWRHNPHGIDPQILRSLSSGKERRGAHSTSKSDFSSAKRRDGSDSSAIKLKPDGSSTPAKADASVPSSPPNSIQIIIPESAPSLELDMVPNPAQPRTELTKEAGSKKYDRDPKKTTTAKCKQRAKELEAYIAAAAIVPAIETAVTAKPTELLAIGIRAYQMLLAEGVKRNLDKKVAVLRATNAMVSVVLRFFELKPERREIKDGMRRDWADGGGGYSM